MNANLSLSIQVFKKSARHPQFFLARMMFYANKLYNLQSFTLINTDVFISQDTASEEATEVTKTI